MLVNGEAISGENSLLNFEGLSLSLSRGIPRPRAVPRMMEHLAFSRRSTGGKENCPSGPSSISKTLGIRGVQESPH